MNNQQISAIVCAYCDLVGAEEAREQQDIELHDWKAHRISIEELEKAFPFIKDPQPTNE